MTFVAGFNFADYFPKRYTVESAFGGSNGKVNLVNVYAGNDYDEAVRITNFWDERQNTYFTDHWAGGKPDALTIAMLKFDKLEKQLLKK